MKQNGSKKEFSLLDEVEKRLQEIEERMSEMEEKTKKSFAKIQEYIAVSDTINRSCLIAVSQIVLLSTKTKGEASDFDVIIEKISEIQDDIKRVKVMSLNAPPIDTTALVDMILTLSKDWNISFEVIAPYLIEKLGKECAKDNVKKASIMQSYGSQAMNNWEKLFKE